MFSWKPLKCQEGSCSIPKGKGKIIPPSCLHQRKLGVIDKIRLLKRRQSCMKGHFSYQFVPVIIAFLAAGPKIALYHFALKMPGSHIYRLLKTCTLKPLWFSIRQRNITDFKHKIGFSLTCATLLKMYLSIKYSIKHRWNLYSQIPKMLQKMEIWCFWKYYLWCLHWLLFPGWTFLLVKGESILNFI